MSILRRSDKMGMNKYNKNKVISSKYAKGIDFNDYVEGFIDEEGPDVRNNDDRRTKAILL